MKVKVTSAITLLLLATTTTIHAANTTSCSIDVQQMEKQIQSYGSITSPIDGQRFNAINHSPQAKDETFCSTYGYFSNKHITHLGCEIIWEKGSWGNTFHCNS